MVMAVLAAPVAANNGNGSGRGNGDGGGTVWNKKKCEDAGGYWYNERGVKSCNTIQEVPFDRPVGEGEVDPVVRDFWAGIDDDEIIGFLVLVATDQTQRGNVGAPGTSNTLATIITCTMLGLDDVLPPAVCDWIAQGYDPDPHS